MKPAWDQLANLHSGSSRVLIGDVDCTSEDGRPACKRKGVKSYPTLMYYKYGDEAGTEYAGGRDLTSFDAFVKKNLEAKRRTEL